jgi:TonB family protein
MKLGSSSSMGRRLMGFLVLSLGAHAAAFSLFRDPGKTSPLYPQGAGKVILSTTLGGDAGLADLFDPSAIVLPADEPKQLASTVTLPWQGMAWPERPIPPAPKYRPDEVGQDAPLAVKATISSPLYRIKRPTTSSRKGDGGAKTWWELSGDLRKRKPTKPIELTPIQSANALEPTTARIGVDEDGAVRFVFLEGSTGDAAVDREASSLIRTWRFEPSQGHWIEWGRVRILWAVEPPNGGKP